ncbi:MAG: thioredoxin family protein [Pleurocapsa minor GSE-CHR-MK-17-07R]|jgi:thiol-disulfide isomerase/thioredoxin|nr:thioredoxin family protein [Pleurocapsa minor GSE-CHR-MK 17-07R]
MLERLILAVLLLAVGFIAYRLAIAAQKRRTTGLIDQTAEAAALPAAPATIMYFTTPTCVACRTTQRPALELVKQTVHDNVRVVTIDASEQPEVAGKWGVFSAPTTFVIDHQGRTVAVNHGVADAQTLLKQLRSASPTYVFEGAS